MLPLCLVYAAGFTPLALRFSDGLYRGAASVIRDNVAFPSLSPDGTRIGYKKLIDDKGHWRLHVLDLASGSDVALAETRSVDDQLEWRDDHNLLYQFGDDVWTVPADGSGAARVYIKHAGSPAVVR